MFYSETLLQKTGPLARVWLSANLERKLSKHQILHTNLSDNCQDIITPNQAPLALRLSGQLLLGVVRIYSRKARYLLDDCNEALLKIKMAFRTTGNHDLPETLGMPNREANLLPDKITPADNLNILPAFGGPMPNADWLLTQMDEVDATPNSTGARGRGRPSNRGINLDEDFNNSQFYQDDTMNEDGLALATTDDLDLELDLGLDLDDRPAVDKSMDIEMGRNAPEALGDDDDIFSQTDLAPRGKGVDQSMNDVRIADDDGDINMDDQDLQFNIDESGMPNLDTGAGMGRERISESPLSDIDENMTKQLEEWRQQNNTSIYEPGHDTLEPEPAPQKKSKKRKAFGLDPATQLTSAHIKEQQQNHDNILKNPSFISRDPYLLALVELKNGGSFVSSVMSDSRSKAWAPELQGLISIDSIRAYDERKRKRDSGIADMSEDEQGVSKSPRLEINDDDDGFAAPDGGLGDRSVAADGTVLEIPGEDDGAAHDDDMEGNTLPAFDETTAPIVHPEDSGPVSMGTKHAVHVLRDLFGPEAANSEEKRKKSSVVFQELLPEVRTTKADATKMFFECLVLATKDAVKVEQKSDSNTLGGPIRIRGKRGLWGAWAEREAGGEIANREGEDEAEAPTQAPPNVAGSSQPVMAAA